MGDAYLELTQEAALRQVELDTERVSSELDSLQQTMSECESGMQKLKAQLYGKFGNNISASSVARHSDGRPRAMTASDKRRCRRRSHSRCWASVYS